MSDNNKLKLNFSYNFNKEWNFWDKEEEERQFLYTSMVNVACQSKKAMGENPNACSTIKVGIHQHFLVFYSPVVFFSHFCLMEILSNHFSKLYSFFFMTKIERLMDLIVMKKQDNINHCH